MKSLTTVLVLAVVMLLKFTAQAAVSSLELVLTDDHVTFTTRTNISLEMVLRNVGETNMNPNILLSGLSVVLDGKEYKRDPKLTLLYTGVREFKAKSGWRSRFALAEFLIPPEALAAGRHKVALRDASSKSNTMTIFIEAR
jgi:hypothetical protein